MLSRRLRIALGLAGLLLTIVVVNASIAGKERLLAQGRVVYLELAPVDPRSLMQGDYMRLNYAIAADIRGVLPEREESRRWPSRLAPMDGRAVVRLDKRSVATFERLYQGQALAADEVVLRFRVRNGTLRFASNAFYFQEGTAEDYQPARYGSYRVGPDGELLLTALHDENLRQLPASDQ